MFGIPNPNLSIHYATSKVEHLIAFTAIFCNVFTVHVRKRLFMNFQCKFRHHRSIPWPRFPYRVRNFGDLATFSIDFFAFYMLKVRQSRFVWPTGLESIPHASTRTAIISTKFEVGMAIHYRVIAFLLLIRYVTLWPWSLTCWPRTVVTVVIHTWAPKCRPPKDTSLRGSAEPCRLTYFASKSVRVSAVAFFKNPPPKK